VRRLPLLLILGVATGRTGAEVAGLPRSSPHVRTYARNLSHRLASLSPLARARAESAPPADDAKAVAIHAEAGAVLGETAAILASLQGYKGCDDLIRLLENGAVSIKTGQP